LSIGTHRLLADVVGCEFSFCRNEQLNSLGYNGRLIQGNI